MVTGIRVEITGQEICAALDDRINRERQRADRWKYEAGRPPESQTIEEPVLPTHICMNEERLSLWRADRLAVIQRRIKPSEVYLLNKRELDFLGLLPAKPTLLGPYDLEDESHEEFTIERIDTGRDGLEVTRIRNIGALEKP